MKTFFLSKLRRKQWSIFGTFLTQLSTWECWKCRFKAFRFQLRILWGSMPPHLPRGSHLRRLQKFPQPLQVVRFQFKTLRLDTLPLCVFGRCIAYNSDISYLVPVLEVSTPPPPRKILATGLSAEVYIWHDGNKNNLKTIDQPQILQKLKNKEPQPKFTGKKKSV